jgi:hypothetical protein
MYTAPMNAYYAELQTIQDSIDNLECNLSVYLGMSHFEGLAPGAKQEAKRYMAYAPACIVELKIKLNNGRIPICRTYLKSLEMKTVKFPSNAGHMK